MTAKLEQKARLDPNKEHYPSLRTGSFGKPEVLKSKNLKT